MVPAEQARPGASANADYWSWLDAARIHDSRNGASSVNVDQTVQRAFAQMPALPSVIKANQSFQTRAVRHMLAAGIRQFLDLRAVVPVTGGVHEIAQRHDRNVRVVHVERDPVAAAVAAQTLAGNRRAAMIHADPRYPDQILTHPDVRRLLDLTRPVGVLMVGALHLIPDADDPAAILRYLHAALPVGSYLGLSHLTPVQRQSPAGMREMLDTCARNGGSVHPRSADQIEALLGDWHLKPPGLVACPHWRPDPDTEPIDNDVIFPAYAALTRKTTEPRRDGKPPGRQRPARPAEPNRMSNQMTGTDPHGTDRWRPRKARLAPGTAACWRTSASAAVASANSDPRRQLRGLLRFDGQQDQGPVVSGKTSIMESVGKERLRPPRSFVSEIEAETSSVRTSYSRSPGPPATSGMRAAGLAGKSPRRWRTTTIAGKRPDLVRRGFCTDPGGGQHPPVRRHHLHQHRAGRLLLQRRDVCLLSRCMRSGRSRRRPIRF